MSVQEARYTERFANGLAAVYPIPVPYRHWQLRDMIKVLDGKIVYNNIDKMIALDTETKTQETLVENLMYYPTTFDVSKRFLACGSSKGEITIYDRYTKRRIELETGYTIINSVKIRNNCLYVCSNERTISVVNLFRGVVANVYTHTSQVNNCEVSQKGDYLIACGDTKEVLMFSCNNNSLKLAHRFESANDGGFGVSWNGNDSMFAVGTQDGYACVWDIRAGEKLAAIKSHQHPYASGAIRNLQFTKKNFIDMLIFTEHYSYFSILDTRNFNKRQLITVNEAAYERSITGLAINEESDTIYVSTGENILGYAINTNMRRMSCYGEFF